MGVHGGEQWGDAWLGSSWCWTLDTGAGGKLKFTLCSEKEQQGTQHEDARDLKCGILTHTHSEKKPKNLGLREASFDRGVRGSNLKEDKPEGAWKTKP